MQQSAAQRKLDIKNQEKSQIEILDFKKLLDIRIKSSKEEIERLESKLEYFKTENAKSSNQKQYFFERRKFIFASLQLMQNHLNKLLSHRAKLEGEDIQTEQLEVILSNMEELNEQNIEIMKTFAKIQNLSDDQPLPKDFQMISERMARNYTIPLEDKEVDIRFGNLNNYFQNEIQKYYKTPGNAPYLQFIPKLT